MIVEDFRGNKVGVVKIIGGKLYIDTNNQKLKNLLANAQILDFFSGVEKDSEFVTLSNKVGIKDSDYLDALSSYLGNNNFILILT